MIVEIDRLSGFCFGVVRAISEAERALKQEERLFSLGDIVHNRIEVQRLEELGLGLVSVDEMERAAGKSVLIRAHGEPPTTYRRAEALGIKIIDATCPVVAKLQLRVKAAYDKMCEVGGEVVLLGKRGHAEVVGLTGQVEDRVRVVERMEDLEGIDFSRPIFLLSQTTQSIALFEQIAAEIRRRASSTVEVCDTICRQVSSREGHLQEFVARHDVVIFVCGKKSSNGKVLFEVCRAAKGERCYNIEEAAELELEWFAGARSVGICGATSTPAWLMENIAEAIHNITKL